MMDGGMGSMMSSMMGWMMALGLVGWVLVIALLVTIVVLIIRVLRRAEPKDGRSSGSGHTNLS
jgi:uncharacterized membrane protein